jgi:thiol:disulfide interchange protein DsbD
MAKPFVEPPGRTPISSQRGLPSKAPAPKSKTTVNCPPLTGVAALEQALSSSSDQPVLLYFGAEWCTACKDMERTTFRDPGVREKLKKFRLFKVDVTDTGPETQALLKKFSLFGPPAILLFQQGQEISQARMIGEQDARQFLSLLEQALKP